MCVTGMHRSGTSFTACVLELLGVYWGSPDRLMAPGPDNPAGYWENRDLKELNDELLARLGGSWDLPPVLHPGWEQALGLDPLRKRASDILDDAFGTSRSEVGTIGWKDPRLSLLLPFWRTVTPIATTIVVVRDPLEVAASLRARNGIDAPQAMMLWLTYLYAAIANDPGCLVVRDRDFFVDLPKTLAAIANYVGLPPPTRDTLDQAREHLDPSLRHHVATVNEHSGSNPLVAMAAAVWNDGAIDLERVPTVVADAVRSGWLRAPIDAELLARARAEVITMRDRIRQRRRQERAAQGQPSDKEPDNPSSPISEGDASRQIEAGDG